MKKVFIITVLAVLVASLAAIPAMAAKGGPKSGCATIQDGTILASTGETLTTGYDEYGYNYQAHMFNGIYSDADRDHEGGDDTDFSDVNLMMKWNDAWLSNRNCDEDEGDLLDRHYGYDTYRGSGAWLTNHDVGVSEDGSRWAYFVKIVAVPVDATLTDGTWYAADSTEIGPDIWGQFAVIQQIIAGDIPQDFIDYDLPFAGNFISPSGAGLGNW